MEIDLPSGSVPPFVVGRAIPISMVGDALPHHTPWLDQGFDPTAEGADAPSADMIDTALAASRLGEDVNHDVGCEGAERPRDKGTHGTNPLHWGSASVTPVLVSCRALLTLSCFLILRRGGAQ